MDVTQAPVLFNMKNLNAAGMARIEQSVKAARQTLALADRLKSLRDETKAFWRFQDSLKNGTSLGSRKLLDISL